MSIVTEFKKDFRNNYSHIYFEDFVSDEEIENFIEENIEYSYPVMLDTFSDFLQSQGKCEVTL